MNSYGDGNTYRGTACKDSEVPTIITDGKTAYTAKDYPIHSSGPWSVTAGIVSDREGRLLGLLVEDCSGNPVCATSARGVQGRVPIMEANAKLIAAAPEMLEVLRWLDAEMDERVGYDGVMFSHRDFERVRRAIKLAIEGQRKVKRRAQRVERPR